jgi:hypothetical protein
MDVVERDSVASLARILLEDSPASTENGATDKETDA